MDETESRPAELLEPEGEVMVKEEREELRELGAIRSAGGWRRRGGAFERVVGAGELGREDTEGEGDEGEGEGIGPRLPMASIRPRPVTPSRNTPTTSDPFTAGSGFVRELGEGEFSGDDIVDEDAVIPCPLVDARETMRSHLRFKPASSVSC